MHYKICLYLYRNYDRIMVTDFSSKKVSKKEGNLNWMFKRILHKLSHYRFRQHLQNKCQEYGCQYLEVSEDYTSKTCGLCGEVNNKLGNNKIFNCEKCKNKIEKRCKWSKEYLNKES